MGKTLVLTEKPSVGREVAKILNCNQKGNGCFVGAKYIVVWALGRRTKAVKLDYSIKLKQINL